VASAPTQDQLAVASRDGSVFLVDTRSRSLTGTLGQTQYAFRLTPGTDNAPAAPVSLGEAAQRGELRLEILRNTDVLRSQPVRPGPGPLHLRVRRQGDRLEVQLNQEPALVFLDAFALPLDSGAYGVVLAPGLGLMEFRGQRQSLPAQPSGLERGDALRARGRHAEALAAYQAGQGASGAAGAEARFKAALCLLALTRTEEAAGALERLAGEAGPTWPLLAASRLWLLRLEQNRLEDAEGVFTALSARYQLSELVAMIPREFRSQILSRYQFHGRLGFLTVRPEEIQHQERALAVLDFFQSGDRIRARGDLARMLVMFEQTDRALEVMRAGLRLAESLPPAQGGPAAAGLLSDYCWLFRQRGQAREGLEELERWLGNTAYWEREPGKYSLFLHLEKARMQVALGQEDEAARTIDDTLERLRQQGGCTDYFHWSSLQVMKGFLADRRGQPEAARLAWQQGIIKSYLIQYPGVPPAEADVWLRATQANLQHLIMRALTDDLRDTEVEPFIQHLLRGFGDDNKVVQFINLVRIPPSAVRKMWLTPRGREAARRIAFRELSLYDNTLAPPLLLGLEILKQGAFTKGMTPEQEEVVWAILQKWADLFLSGKMSRTQLLQLGLTWKGTTNFLGWGSVAPALPPEVRGGLAYLFGHRFLHLGKKAEASTFFRTASADAPEGSPLRRLAQAELTQLDIK